MFEEAIGPVTKTKMSTISVLISIIFFVGIMIGIKYLAYLSREGGQRDSWQQLAASNNLDFVPGTFFNQGISIVGNYRQHQLMLDTFLLPLGRKNQVYTRLTIWVNLAADSNDEQGLLNIQNALAQLNSIHSLYPLKGHIETVAYGQTVYYEQQGIEEDIEYLQSLFDVLSEVIDVYPKIIALGGEAVPSLHTIITAKSHILNFVAVQLLQDIAMETTSRLKHQVGNLFCSQCLVSIAAHKVNGVTYYGCRACGQSREFVEARIVAVLDQEMALEQMRQSDILRVNCLIRRDLFDFGEVEIIQATDEEVERFAIQLGNDTDIVRRPRYKQMRCSISSSCKLTENTKRILQHMFGLVVEMEQPYPSI